MDQLQNYFNIKDTSVSAAMAPTNISKSHAELFLGMIYILKMFWGIHHVQKLLKF